jgi:uncharacterized membrane protein
MTTDAARSRRALDLPPGVRLAVAAAAGVAVGVVLNFESLTASLLGGWAAAGLIFTAWTLAVIVPMDAQETAEHALREEPTRFLERVVVLIAALASLAGLVVVLAGGGLRTNPLTAATVLAAVVASWASVHTLFAVRYARLYYTPPVGGIDFHNDDEAPQYTDFTYISFTVGMSFAISDTDLRTTAMRKAAQVQGLLAYLFGTVVVALLVNLIAGLAG